MESERLKILDKIESVEALKLLKSEAEMVLDESLSSESIITNKANTIFQILIVLLFSVLGFIASTFPDINVNSHLIRICLFLICVTGSSIWYLLKIIYPRLTYSKGTIPSKLLHDDIVFKDWEEFSILKNRIYNLEEAIKQNKKIQSERISNFKISIYILLIGISLITLYSLIIIL
ncbi:hypothetical protein SAMN05444377_1252 [Flavobacterium fontis]|uniref:Uncharacterized protein n=1 Tax=Flavobacterium fontis TaxID=1124188 RepID=A0A1M5EZW6_9FLAO|nr:hypothetical protein [Flavobacterium fontis]SHF84870.1 hypothetical protein SAMN05444377_1252 [Flavobacterium fontis]